MQIRRIYLLLALLALCLSWVSLAIPATQASTLCVKQGGGGGCYSTIGAALGAAAPGDTITIAADANPYYERLTITQSVSLVGDGAAGAVIDGNQAGRVISVSAGINVTISNLTIENGKTPDDVYTDYMMSGGGIFNNGGNLTLNNSVLGGNRTGKGGGLGGRGGNGGGLFSTGGALSLHGSTVSGNGTGDGGDGGAYGGNGGGIYVNAGTLKINHGIITGNTTGRGGGNGSGGFGGKGGKGGGIWNSGATVTVTFNHLCGQEGLS